MRESAKSRCFEYANPGRIRCWSISKRWGGHCQQLLFGRSGSDQTEPDNPSALYFILNERCQDYFMHNESRYEEIVEKLYIIGVYFTAEAKKSDCGKEVLEHRKRRWKWIPGETERKKDGD